VCSSTPSQEGRHRGHTEEGALHVVARSAVTPIGVLVMVEGIGVGEHGHEFRAALVERIDAQDECRAAPRLFVGTKPRAEVVWEVTYVAGEDAKALFAQRLSAGAEAFRRVIGQMFLG
jgi:hypothetical protein